MENLQKNSLNDIYKKISSVVPEVEWKVHAPLIEKINKLFEQLREKENKGHIAWGDLFSNKHSSNYREIIHVQPQLDPSNLFPAKKILGFLGGAAANSTPFPSSL